MTSIRRDKVTTNGKRKKITVPDDILKSDPLLKKNELILKLLRARYRIYWY
ncbi:hypothetical protein WY13_01921 [Clostridium ljungdahlii]|uniref:Uncharacterized protein n=1 Tax=Clostridium ljungdahlii TaxID=1538 RepID=A0A162L2X2_9CLOT|nr:hypothetical protein WY13_01921 [Clostridium ljungdahlii]